MIRMTSFSVLFKTGLLKAAASNGAAVISDGHAFWTEPCLVLLWNARKAHNVKSVNDEI